MKLPRPAALLVLSVCLSLAWLVFAPEPLLAQAEPGGANGGRKLTGNLTTGMSGRTWRISPDGEHVVFTSGAQDQIGLYSVPVDGRSKPVLLGANLTEAWAERYTISADGQWVYYLASPAGSSVLINELVVAPVSGGMTTTLFGPAPYIAYQLTPDQTQIVASAHVTESSDSANLYVLPVQDWGVASITATQLVTGIANYLANLTLIAPDGETILFASWDGPPISERATLYAVPTGGGAVRTLTDHLSLAIFAASPQFSPDGATVVYPGDASGTCALCAVKVATGQTVELVPYAAGFGIVDAPQISPDGEYVVFQASPPTQSVALENLFSVPLAGGAINTLATVLEDGGRSIRFSLRRIANRCSIALSAIRTALMFR
ncbi:MAG: hypothetical protein IPK16_28950 [Anaerolineales bacterium]|nr:hypothetical protein [Anaerolineales bacterium]